MTTKKVWLVEATGHSNEAIAGDLAGVLRAENIHRDVLCQDGKKRDFWEVDYAFVRKLKSNEENARLRFKVFYRVGRNGPVKLWPFLYKKRKTLAQALKSGMLRKGSFAAQAG